MFQETISLFTHFRVISSFRSKLELSKDYFHSMHPQCTLSIQSVSEQKMQLKLKFQKSQLSIRWLDFRISNASILNRYCGHPYVHYHYQKVLSSFLLTFQNAFLFKHTRILYHIDKCYNNSTTLEFHFITISNLLRYSLFPQIFMGFETYYQNNFH